MKFIKKTNDPNTTLGVVERFAYGFGNAGNSFLVAAITGIMIYYFTDTLHLSAGIVGTLLLLSRLFDGVTDLLMGHIVDRTKSKFGKARPWILRACLPYAVCGVLLFAVPTDLSTNLQYAYIFVMYNLTNSFAYTAMFVPYSTLPSMMTRNQYERGLLGVFSLVFSVAGGLIFNAFALDMIASFGGDTFAWVLTVGIFAVIGVVMQVICFLGTKERIADTFAEKGAPEPTVGVAVKSLFQNKYWVIHVINTVLVWLALGLSSTATIYYADEILGNEGYYATLTNTSSIVQLLFLFIATFIMKKKGKVFCFRLGAAIMGVGMLMVLPFDSSYPVLLASSVLKGVGSGIAGAVLFGMSADTIDYGEWKTGIRAAGLASSAMAFAQKVGQGFASGAVGWILEAGKKIGMDAYTFSIKISALYLPIVLTVIILALTIPYKLDKEYDTIMVELDERNRYNAEAQK